MDKKTNELLKVTVIYLIGNGLVTFLQFFILKIITKNISKEDYGYYELVVSLSNILIPVISLQIADAIFRYAIRGNEEEKKRAYSNGLVIIAIGVVISLIASVIYKRYIQDIKCYYLILGFFGMNIVFTIYQKIARIYGKNKTYVLANIVKTVLYFVFQITLIYFFKIGIESIFLSMILSIAVCNILMEVKLRCSRLFSWKKISLSYSKMMIKFSLPLVPNTIFYWLSSSINALIITNELGLGANGVYAVSLKFSTILSIISSMFLLAWQESSIKYYDKNNSVGFFSNVLTVFVRLNLVFASVLISLCFLVVPYIVDKSFLDAKKYIPILIFNSFFSALYGFCGVIFSAIDRTKIIFFTTILGAISNFAIVFSLIKFADLYAPAVAGMVSSLIIFLTRYRVLKDFIKYKWDIQDFFLLMSVIISVSFYYLNNTFLNILIIPAVCLTYCLFNKRLIFDFIEIAKNHIFFKSHDMLK